MPTTNYIITTRVIVGAVASILMVFIVIGVNRYLDYVDDEKAKSDAERKKQIEFNVQFLSKVDTLIWLNRIQNTFMQNLSERLGRNEQMDKEVRKAVRKGERTIDDP